MSKLICNLFIKIFLFLVFFHSFEVRTQPFNGIYKLANRDPRTGPKDFYHFYNDTSFRYVAHSISVVVGEGTFRIVRDSILLYFNTCQNCKKEFQADETPDSLRPGELLFTGITLAFGTPVLGIVKENRAFKLKKWSKALITLQNNISISSYKRTRGSEKRRFFRGLKRFFIL